MSNHFVTLETREDGLCFLTLNRPEKHNAFNPEVIALLKTHLEKIEKDPAIRTVLLRGEGRHFCAGADLNWMKATASYSKKENEKDALALAELLARLQHLPKPTIALVQGRVMGGGIGLVACCDIVIASDDARFCFSEVKLGLIPATIAPHVIQRIGYAHARRYFITAALFDAVEAQRINLADSICANETLLETGLAIADTLKNNGPQAMAAAKQLVNTLRQEDASIAQKTAHLLAEIRSSEEAQEGIEAFFEKRPANWVQEKN